MPRISINTPISNYYFSLYISFFAITPFPKKNRCLKRRNIKAMDPQLTEVSQQFERFKAAFVRKDYNSCSDLLSTLKVTRFKKWSPSDLRDPCFASDWSSWIKDIWKVFMCGKSSNKSPNRLDKGVTVYTCDSRGVIDIYRTEGSNAIVTSELLSVLVNKGTAGASEILVGALKDN